MLIGVMKEKFRRKTILESHTKVLLKSQKSLSSNACIIWQNSGTLFKVQIKTHKNFELKCPQHGPSHQSALCAAHVHFYHQRVKKTNPSSQTQILLLIQNSLLIFDRWFRGIFQSYHITTDKILPSNEINIKQQFAVNQ